MRSRNAGQCLVAPGTWLVSSPRLRREPSPPGVLFINSGIIHRRRCQPYLCSSGPVARAARSGDAALRPVGHRGQQPARGPAQGSQAEIAQRDIDDALSLLQREGAGPLIVAGLCSGADDSLAAIVRNSRVSGAVLLDPLLFRRAGTTRNAMG